MTVLDAYAVIAALRGEAALADVEELLRDPEQPTRISAVNVAEVFDVLVRAYARTAAEVLERLVWLEAGGLEIAPADEALGRLAGELRARHYHRTARPLSLADCFALATAVSFGERLATSDPPLTQAARATGVSVVALRDSRGRRP